MLNAALDALLSPLYNPGRVRFVPLRPHTVIGSYMPPDDILYPVDEAAKPPVVGESAPIEDLAAGVIYVLCYRPLHRESTAFLQLALAYVRTNVPEFPARLAGEARQAMADGDWVGTVGRLWTIVQLSPGVPEPLDELAQACLAFGFITAARGDLHLAARMARAAGAALNLLLELYPAYAPGHLRRAEFLAAAGGTPRAALSVREALRLGLPPDLTQDAYDLLTDLTAGKAKGDPRGGERGGILSD